MTLHVAIIGSGPAGYYTAEALTKDRDDVQVDIIDRLPTPYGLIRGGVAPDHQSIKGVYKRYEKTNLQDTVRFVGNIEIGDALSVAELGQLYDAVVLATGAGRDRPLGIPGADKKGVIGSAAFVGWYNAHPDFAGLDPDLDVEAVAVIGNGNVAIDVARVLAKTPDEMAVSDLARYAAERIQSSPIRDIHMFGRRGPVQANFTPKELGELGELKECVALVEGAQLPDAAGDAELPPVKRKNLGHLRQFAERDRGARKLGLYLTFYARPVEVLGGERVEGLRLERTTVDEAGLCHGTNETFDIACGLVIPCIGYRTQAIPGVAFDNDRGRFINDDGLIAPGLYCTGWARRGPTGTIGTNRSDGIEIAEAVLANAAPGGKPGRQGLDRLMKERDLWPVTFRDWQKIEAAEQAAAQGDAPRRKFSSIDEMLKILKPPAI